MDTTGAGAGGDAFLKIEPHGIEAIPAAERHGRPRELALLWAGAFVNYATILTASYLVGFGLGVWDGLAAIGLGTVSGAVILGLLSNTGPASGLPQVRFTRSIYGHRGMLAGAALTLFLAVGWFAVDSVVAAQAGVQLLSLAGVADSGRLALPLVLVVAALSVVVAVYGHQTIRVMESVGAVAFVTLSLVLFASLAGQFHWTAAPTASGSGHWAAAAQGFLVCFALVASWYPFASDYSRYLSADRPRSAVTVWPVLGIAVPLVLLGLFGVLLATIDPRAASPLEVITAHAPGWVAIPFLLFVVLGEVWANYLDVYTAGLVTLTLGVRLERWQTALGCGVLGAALATYAVVVSDFHDAYEQFLVLTYLWAPAWAAVVVLAFFGARPGPAWPALVAWVLGTLTSLLFVNYPGIFPSLHGAFNDGLVARLGGADLSGLVSLGLAGAAYLLLRRLAARAPA